MAMLFCWLELNIEILCFILMAADFPAELLILVECCNATVLLQHCSRIWASQGEQNFYSRQFYVALDVTFYFQTYDNKTPAVFQITSGLLLVSSLLRVSPDSRGSACGKMVKLFKLRVAVWGEAGVSVLTSHWSLANILASDWPTLTRPSSSRNIHSAPAGPRPHRPAKHKESQINMPQASGPLSSLKSLKSQGLEDVWCSSDDE